MDGKRRSVKRTLGRVHEVCRLEAQLLALVYEQLWATSVVRTPAKPRPIRVRTSCTVPFTFAQGA
jgi:hypothetical protein